MDVHLQTIASSDGFSKLWSQAVGLHLATRALYNFRFAIDFAYIARDMDVKKDQRDYRNEEDRNAINTAVSLAQSYFLKAKAIITPNNEVYNIFDAAQNLDSLANRFSTIDNITAALLFVDEEKCKFFCDIYF